ncbi:MAG TPA: HAMP domain-containing sensor histidine kinase [Longimicrobiales bacterium]|nr:HAMP domain-containing sensor histidine kinase [Longimicrobiales bacterium]
MTLRLRLILTIGGVALLMVLPALYAAYRLRTLSEIATSVSTTHGAAYAALSGLHNQLGEIGRLQRRYIALPEDSTSVPPRDTALVRARSNVDNLGAAGYSELAAEVGTSLDRVESETRYLDGLVVRDELQAASDRLPQLISILSRTDTLLARIGSEIDTRSETDLQAASLISATALTTTLLALLACFSIAVLLGTWITHALIQPLTSLRRSMAAVSAGEFIVPGGLPYDRRDELGDLSRSFRSMTRQLADLDRMKADFMSVATHELKTPINVVSGYAELIQEGVYGEISEKQQVALTSIQEQSRILTQLVNQLLDISRLEAGGLKLEIGELSLSDLFERVHRTFEVLANKQGIQFSVHLAEDAPASIPADGDRLRDQVLGNILGNALKFTPEGGRIGVRGWTEGDRFRIEVSDTGAGMPAEQLPHVFDKYYQIGEQARSKGAGLGLAIAHDVVHAHGGSISVTSEEGSGTTFRIDLPTTREQMEEAARRAQQESAAVDGD